MKNRILNLLIVSLLVFSVLVTTAQPVSAHPDKNHGLQGVISAIDLGASSLTITPKKGADVVLKVDSSTVITRSQHPATLADLQLGDRVEANYDPSTMLAKRVKADPNLATVKGTIKAVDTGASTLTVTPKNGGADVVLNVDSTTQIMRNGAAATLADLQVSDIVQARYNPVNFLAASIAAWPNLVMLKGTISAVDSGAGTLTVTPKGGGADVVLNVDSTTQIMRNGAAATLADLQVGDSILAKYNAGSFLAVYIWAWPNLTTLKGTISAVDTGASTLTVTPKGGGADVVLNVDSTTQIMRSGVAASLADLQVGDSVQAKYNPITFLAASISAWPAVAWVKGTISAVDTGAGTVSVTPKGGGADVVLNVDGTTQIFRNGAPVSLSALQPGDRVEAKYYAASLLAINIMAWPNLVMVKGNIKAVDTGAGTLTVTPKNGGADVVLKVDSTTQILRNNTAASLADLQVGDRLLAKYNAVTFLADSIWAWPNQVPLEGSIAAVDTGAGTVTVTPKGGGADVVLNVDSTTQIHRNGTVATLADLHTGDRINAKYNPVTFLAAEIWAWPNYVSIWGTISGVDTGASTVTITPKNGGADVVLKVDSNTMIRRSHNQASLADLQVGDHVFGIYDQATLLATMLIVVY